MTTRAAVLLAIPLLFAAGCGDDEKPTGAYALACKDLTKPADASVALPSDLPAADGQVLYEKVAQGSTTVYFAHLESTDVVKVRDAIKEKFAAAGYTKLEDDAEPPAEAELEFEGKHVGSVQVTPLCEGHVKIRYKLS